MPAGAAICMAEAHQRESFSTSSEPLRRLTHSQKLQQLAYDYAYASRIGFT